MAFWHSPLEVINVGHGDCMILRPTYHCIHHNTAFIIDTGDGTKDYTQYLDENDKHIALLLTHSHKDHIGGVHQLNRVISRVNQIILPYYYHEIVLISKALQNLQGMERIADDSASLMRFREYEQQESTLRTLYDVARTNGTPSVIYAYDGLMLCDHFEFLNPPILSQTSNNSLPERINTVTALFNHDFAIQLKCWLKAHLIQGQKPDTPRLKCEPIGEQDPDQTYNQHFAKGYFVLSFLEENHQLMLRFTQKPTERYLKPVEKALKLSANRASVVFQYRPNSDHCDSILFTGDIDIPVFQRILQCHPNLQSDVLKVPHHGSKTGLDGNILSIVCPKYAIICHNNRRFGQSADALPNLETINLLRAANVDIHVTNNVIKNGSTIVRKKSLFKAPFSFKDPY